MEKPQSVWDKHAQNSIKRKYASKSTQCYFERWLSDSEPCKILDAGCGFGNFVNYALRVGHEVVGIDFSTLAVNIAKQNLENNKGSILSADVRVLPFKDEKFDMILSDGVIEHFKESELAIEESWRVLRKRGILLIHVPHRHSIFVVAKVLQQISGLWKLGYEKSFTIKKFENLLEQVGFKILERHRAEIASGRTGIGKILRLLDKPLYSLGLGGAHIYFKCKK